MTILIVSVSKVDNLDLFLETWFSLLETQTILSHYTMLMSIAWWDENRRLLETRTNWVSKCNIESWVSRNKHVLYSPLERILRHDLFVKKNKFAQRANSTAKSTCMYKCICKVNKIGPLKGFYLKVWKIDSVFWHEV